MDLNIGPTGVMLQWLSHNAGMDAVSLPHTHTCPLLVIDFHLVLQTDWRMIGRAGEAVLLCSVLSSPLLHLKVECHVSVLGTASWVKKKKKEPPVLITAGVL